MRVKGRVSKNQGIQSPEGMKFPNFSMTFPDYNSILMCVQECLGGSGGMLPQIIFKIKMLRLAKNQFHTTKFSDFSLTFSLCIKIP